MKMWIVCVVGLIKCIYARCRPHVVGRTCNQPEQTFFTASIDFYTYEAELARASEVSNFSYHN